MNEFFKLLLGDYTVAAFCASMVFAFAGILISLLLHATTRNPLTKESPVKFSWKYLKWDNSQRILLAILTTVVTIRFMPELLGTAKSVYLSLLVGLGYDRVAMWLKRKNFIDNEIKKDNPPLT